MLKSFLYCVILIFHNSAVYDCLRNEKDQKQVLRRNLLSLERRPKLSSTFRTGRELICCETETVGRFKRFFSCPPSKHFRIFRFSVAVLHFWEHWSLQKRIDGSCLSDPGFREQMYKEQLANLKIYILSCVKTLCYMPLICRSVSYSGHEKDPELLQG